jgi:hypothetical protein
MSCFLAVVAEEEEVLRQQVHIMVVAVVLVDLLVIPLLKQLP